VTDAPKKKRKGGALDYYFAALRDKVEPAIRGSFRSGSRIAHELAILNFCRAEDSKRYGYAKCGAKAIAAKVIGGPEVFDKLAPKDQAARIRLAQHHIAGIILARDNFVVERGGRYSGMRNANRYWAAVDGAPVHKAFDEQAANRVAAAKVRYEEERERRAEKRKSGLDRWRQRKGIAPKIYWRYDEKGALFGEARDWRINFTREGEECWSMTIIGLDGARYIRDGYYPKLEHQQSEARGFLRRVIKGQVEPSLTAADAAEIAGVFL